MVSSILYAFFHYRFLYEVEVGKCTHNNSLCSVASNVKPKFANIQATVNRPVVDRCGKFLVHKVIIDSKID